MLGIIVILFVSIVFISIFDERKLLVDRFLSSLNPWQFLKGFLLTAMLCFGVQFIEKSLSSSKWLINPEFQLQTFLQMAYWDFKSVLTEELIFRGAILYIFAKRIGPHKAILLSAFAFGVYHWFTFGIIGQIVPMIFVFIGTGLMGYAWALAFIKSKSMFWPIGLHLGWNFTHNSIFSKGPLGKGILFSESGQVISDWYSLVGLILIPLVILLFVKFAIFDKK